MKTFELFCEVNYAQKVFTSAQPKIPTINPYANGEFTGDMITIGFEHVTVDKEKEHAILNFLKKPQNLQYVGCTINAVEITPNTVKYRMDKYQKDIKQSKEMIAVAEDLLLQLVDPQIK
jgi:hypothetical protein